ncbi:hypothetical protein [Otoolea muris]|uniref:hypothetical protein n=1 Tax=Otoolea muris TaxID=2941515 RepID=UPI00203BBC2F|nr:hypothetical protein [Otoolea muris]
MIYEIIPGLTFFVFSILRTTPYKLGLFIAIIAVIITTVISLVKTKNNFTLYSYLLKLPTLKMGFAP